jgi:hypothetical protein
MTGPDSIQRTKQDVALSGIFNANKTSRLQYQRDIYIYIYYCCCFKRYLKLCPNNPCTTIVFKPKIVNSIHSSRGSLKHHNTRVSMKSKNSQDEPVETTELLSLNPTKKQMLLSSKR